MARVVFEMSAKEQAAVQGFLNVQRAIDDTAGKMDNLGKRAKATGTEVGGLSGAGAAAGKAVAEALGIPLTPADALKASLNGVKQVLEFVNREAESGARHLESLGAGMNRLVQISGSGAEFASLKRQAAGLSAKYGMNEAGAQQLLFTAKSMGIGDELDVLGRASLFTDPNAMAESIGKFQSAFGKEGAGGGEQIVNKLLTAAAKSDVSVEEIARASIQAAAPAAQIGGSDEELLAIMSVMSPAFKSPDVAAQRVARLAQGLYAQGLGGEGILSGVKKFQALPEEDRKKFLSGQAEFAAAFQIFGKQEGTIRERMGEIEAAQEASGTKESQLDIKSRIVMGDPATVALLQKRVAEAKEKQAEAGLFGVERLGAEAAESRIHRASMEAGESGAVRFARSKVAGLQKWAGYNQEEIEESQRTMFGLVGNQEEFNRQIDADKNPVRVILTGDQRSAPAREQGGADKER